MKVYRWIKTDDRMVAVVRPAALFDTKGFVKVLKGLSKQTDRELVIKMKHKLRGEFATYALAFERGLPMDRVITQIKQARNLYEEADNAELARLAEVKSSARSKAEADNPGFRRQKVATGSPEAASR